MKIVVLDGYAENPGDLSWEAFEQLGELEVYERTGMEEVISRIGEAGIVVNNIPSYGTAAVSQFAVAAAGLDVLWEEPMRENCPLKDAPNCIITPHISWASKEARQRIMDMAEANLRAFLKGKPENQVNGKESKR